MKMQKLKKFLATAIAAGMLITAAPGMTEAVQEAYDKFAAAAGEGNQEAGFQAGLYRMENGKLEKAIEAFQAYVDDETYQRDRGNSQSPVH